MTVAEISSDPFVAAVQIALAVLLGIPALVALAIEFIILSRRGR